jgi:hypothetical protein
MSDQNRRQDFNEANAIAEYRRQEALTDAYTWFGKTIDDIDREHAERMQATTSAFDAVKSDPRHPSHAQARAAFEAVRGTTPDYKAAHNELDRAVRAAEADFRAELARIGGLYGDTVG